MCILAVGGVGIILGLSTYGYKIMNTIGTKLTAITPVRGSCIELGAAMVVIYGSGQGWPLSTTHAHKLGRLLRLVYLKEHLESIGNYLQKLVLGGFLH